LNWELFCKKSLTHQDLLGIWPNPFDRWLTVEWERFRDFLNVSSHITTQCTHCFDDDHSSSPNVDAFRENETKTKLFLNLPPLFWEYQWKMGNQQ
jgi:hypothetical protein